MHTPKATLVIACLCFLVIPVAAQAQQLSSLDAIREGHWLEIRGQSLEDGIFEAQRVEIIIIVLGQVVELTDKTTFNKLDPDKLANTRLKVEGYHRGVERFSAREVAPRGEGRDRLVGRANLVRRSDEGLEVSIMSFKVRIPSDLQVRHEDSLGDYAVSETRTQPIAPGSRNEDDLFGEGIRLSENLLMAGLVQARWSGEDEFDLDELDPENRQDTAASVRARLIYRPSTQ